MRVWHLLLLACIFVPALQSQERSTQDGVYSRPQWLRGQDLYAGNCRSCHTPEAHAGETFKLTWKGRTLAQLYTYIRGSMPKSDPGALTPEEYADVLAYLLRLNRMPTGVEDLPTDTTALRVIRFDADKP